VTGQLRVALVTTHLPLREVFQRITAERIVSVGRITQAALAQWWGLATPRLALCALNPHAGEGGLFGHEERSVLAPAVETARREGIDVEGPFPADTLFVKAKRGDYDAVVACYHDQGLIPVKLAAFGRAVNVTLGLPFPRTSVDHGTAFDIAARGVADPGSLEAAVALASELSAPRPARVGGSPGGKAS
jgi:4-hydroxythreonine-4-phosphate dehydrogenase